MKKHGVMLFTFVILFLTLGCDLAYGQGEEGNEKEEVTVTLNFTNYNYGLKVNDPIKPPKLNNGIIVQSVKVNLSGYIHVNSNNIRLSDYSGNNSGTIDISVPKNDTIKSIIITAKPATKDAVSKFTVSYMHNQQEISRNYDNEKSKGPIQVNGIDSDHIILTPQKLGKLYLIQITLTYTRPKLDATLDEKGENVGSTISGIAGENKTLTLNRTFNPSQLYTMCLPFDLSKEMITGIFGSETKAYSYDGYQNGELSFSTVKEVNAGMPFLMRPEYYVEQPTFTGVTVESTTAPQIVTGGEWDLCGIFGSHELKADGTQLFLWKDGTLVRPEADSQKMRGFRCYLKKAAGTVNGSAQLPSVTIDGETNAIKTAEYAPPTSATTAYSLSGMKLNAGCKTANGGIMIIDGKKFITTNR